MTARPNVLALLAFLATLVGVVVLVALGQDPTSVISIATPVLGALYVAQRLDDRSDVQDQALARITHQTNGVLDARIQNAVAKALESRDADPGPTQPGAPW